MEYLWLLWIIATLGFGLGIVAMIALVACCGELNERVTKLERGDDNENTLTTI